MKEPHKIKYIEKKPIVRELIFNNRQEYLDFFNPYCQKIIDYCWNNNINYKDYWDYRTNLLNKDGTMRKPTNPNIWLHTKESETKQREGFKKYLERKKVEGIERRKLKEIMKIKLDISMVEKDLEKLRTKLKELENDNGKT
ncbi:MAG TPA: hypothetical protein VIR31_05895 [Nitrososphaeraceae archaeon]